MKKTLIVIVFVIVAFGAGIWLSPYIIPPIKLGSVELSVIGGEDGDYPKEVFYKINDEIPKKTEALLGRFADQDHMIVVTPSQSGYEIYMASPFKTSLWDEIKQKDLQDWIATRMNALRQEYWKLHKEKPNLSSQAIGAEAAPQHGR